MFLGLAVPPGHSAALTPAAAAALTPGRDRALAHLALRVLLAERRLPDDVAASLGATMLACTVPAEGDDPDAVVEAPARALEPPCAARPRSRGAPAARAASTD